MVQLNDNFRWSSKWTIRKYKDRQAYLVDEPYAEEVILGNLGLQEGRQELIDIICGLGTPTKWDSTNARIGVGNSATAPTETDTGLLGASKTFKGMLATYPQRSGQTAKWKSEFLETEANFSWQEFTVVNAADDTGKNLNRVTADKGTKASGEIWTMELDITFNAS